MNRHLSTALLIVAFGSLAACGDDDNQEDVDAGSSTANNTSGDNNTSGTNDGENTGEDSGTNDGENTGSNDGENNGTTGDGTTGDGTTGTTGEPPTPSAAGDIVITELQAAPVGYGVDMDEVAEWVELHNPSTTVTFDLKGCVFSDKAEDMDYIFNDSLLIPPGGYVTASSAAFTVPTHGFVSNAVYGGSSKFGGDGDAPQLVCNATTIDVVNYAGVGFPKPSRFEGYTIQLNPEKLTSADNDTGGNWCYSRTPFSPHKNFGSPGLANLPCVAPTPSAAGDIVITEIQAAPAGYILDMDELAEWVEIHNPSANTYDLGDCTFGDKLADTDYTFPVGTVIPPGAYIAISSAAFTKNTHGFVSDAVYGVEAGFKASGDEPTVVCNGTKIDSVKYSLVDGFPDFVVTLGATIQLDPAHLSAADNDTGSNWCFSTVNFFTATLDMVAFDNKGSPRAANATCVP